jgi:hypothetical protein
MEVPSKNASNRSKCFDYKYFVIGGNHYVEARRELMQEYPNNPLFEKNQMYHLCWFNRCRSKVIGMGSQH